MKSLYVKQAMPALLVLLLCAVFHFGTFAQLATWELSASAGSQVSSPTTTTNVNINPGILQRGAGVVASAAGGSISSNMWFNTAAATTLAQAITNNEYYEFTLPIKACASADITNIQIVLRASGTGPANATLRSSLDGYTADLGTVVVPTTAQPPFTFTVGATNATGTVTFRLYGWGGAAGGGTPSTGGTMRIGTSAVAADNDLIINGTTTAFTPPSSAAITGSGIFCGSVNTSSVPVAVAITGGTSPYTVVLSDGTTNFTVTNYVSNTPISQVITTSKTYTLVSVTDANGCAGTGLTGSAVVQVSTGLAISSPVVTQPTCAAPNSGAIDITPTGGITPYIYGWSNSATTQDIAGLSAGTYTVVLSDAANCSVTQSFTINAPTGCGDPCANFGITDIIVIDPTCASPTGGYIQVSGTGSTQSYNYLWSNNETTSFIANLSAGTYTVTVTSGTCSATKSYTLVACNPCANFNVSVSATNEFCVFPGMVQATATGGTTPYSYNLTGPSSYNVTNATGTFSGLVAGTYALSVTDGTTPTPCTFTNNNISVLLIPDTNPPTITCPAGLTLSCASSALPPSLPFTGTATDDCIPPAPTVTFVGDAISNQTCANRYLVTRTYRATDAAGNSATCAQLISINDQTPPTVTCPNGVTVSCASAVPASNTGAIVSSDNCGGVVTITTSDAITGQTCPNRYTINRSYTATDICLNATNCIQVITVNDQTAPTFNQSPLPSSMNMACTDNLPLPAQLTGSDNCVGGSIPNVIWINEFHYDDELVDEGEFIEVAGTAGLNLANYEIILYNGNGGVVYDTDALTGTIDDEGNGFGAVSLPYPVNGIQNGSPDGIALRRISDNMVLQFISYEGVFQATNGPANMSFSTDIGVAELGADPAGGSLHLTGSGNTAASFTWSLTNNDSPGTLNPGQTITTLPASIPATFSQTSVPGQCPGSLVVTRTWTVTDACGNANTHTQVINLSDATPPVLTPAPANITLSCNDVVPTAPTVIATDACDPAGIVTGAVWINEIHYDNVGIDSSEFVEIAGRAGVNLSGWSLVLYNGAGGGTYNSVNLTGVIPNQSNGFGTISFAYPVNGIQNGAPDGIALVNGGTVIQFLSYEGVFVAVGGAANNLTSTDIGVSETGSEPVGQSLRLSGNGATYAAFTWNGPSAANPATPGQVNQGQTFPPQPPVGLPVTFTEVTSPPSPTCPFNRTITRTWSATDACGNIGVNTQVITIQDITPPVVNCQPLTLTLPITGSISITQANITFTATDNCTSTASLTVLPNSATYTCLDEGKTRTFVVSVRDQCGNVGTCNAQVTINPFPRCTPKILIVDPCVCKNNATTTENGQFGERLKIESISGLTWMVTAVTGLFSAASAPPPSAPTPIAIGSTFTEIPVGSGDYFLNGVHVDAIGYNISVSNGAVTLSIGNSCQYPNAAITSDLSGPFCLYSDAVPLTGTPGDANIISQGFTVNGVAATVFNPGAGVGNYVIIYTVDGGGPKANGANDPGCIQTVTKLVQVIATPSTIVCNDLVQVSLDEDCSTLVNPDMILEGSYGCFDDYEVKITGISGLPNYGSTVTGANIGQTLKATVKHLVSGNTCWGLIKVEDKLEPTITCQDFNVSCAETNLEPSFLAGTLGIGSAFPTAVDNCTGNVTRSFNDVWTDLDCPASSTAPNITGRVTRSWLVSDASGNTATCVQTINIIGARIGEVKFPTDKEISCSSTGGTTPATTGAPFITFTYPSGVRTYTISPNANYCELQTAYVDELLPVCDGTHKILRTWTAYDWCTPTSATPPATNPQYFIQVIKVVDEAGPTYVCPANLTVSTNTNECCAVVDLPSVIMSDNCSRINNIAAQITARDQFTNAVIGTYDVSGILTTFAGNNLWIRDTLADFGYTSCLPLGTHSVVYRAEDDCGNTRTCSFTLQVEDETLPVPVCDQVTQVSLGLNGSIEVLAESLDNGSYDNCSDQVYFKARRMNSSSCQSNGSFFEEVKFCCSDIDNTVQVVLRVYDVFPGNGSVSTTSFEGHFNDCMVTVLVEDKIKPTCTAPANVTVSCEAFDPSLLGYGQPTKFDNCSNPTITNTVVLTQFDSLCNKGTITRRWAVVDASGNSGQCSQRIIVTENQNYWVKFPADRLVSTCDGTGVYGAPEYYGEDCELLATSYTDEFFTVIPDACFKIERTWHVINWCKYDANLPLSSVLNVYVPNPNPNNSTNHPTNLPGVTVSPCGTTVNGWVPTSVKINPTDPTATNYCTFWRQDANSYTYKQIIKVFDTQDPVAQCPSSRVTFCDLSTNDGQFYNAMQYWDPTVGSHDLCEGDANIEMTATDACSGANLSFRYLLFLDMDSNGSMETVINSVNPPGFNNINFNNINNANYTGGTPWQFDFRPVAGDRKWGWGMQTDAANGNSRTARVRWFNQANNPASGAVPQLPYGSHKIKWFIEDGCGNETVCEYIIVVKDCKKPTVVCINGLSVNLMNIAGGMVQLWASDFLQYTEDNCTPSAKIKTAIRRKGVADGLGATTGFPKNADGTPQTGVSFTCADLGTQLVELWGLDLGGNEDYCETYVLIQDNANVCVSSPAIIAGALKTDANQGVEDANIELDGSSNGTPIFKEVFSNVNGNYMFSNALPIAANATVTPTLELDPLNGVNTWDLILVSRHILGLEPLNTPYKLIAADANKSGTVTTFDIVELRKLILGTYTKLPSNSSWRFVDKSQVFTNPANPFADVIKENLSIANLQTSYFGSGDFVATKIGDVDGTATPNGLLSSDDRTAGTLLFDVQDRAVKVGETFTVNFKAADKADGYQFTMNLNGLEVADILPGEKMSTDNFATFTSTSLGGQAITTSVDGSNGEFAVTFRATANGQLSQMINVSSCITKAVAFTSATLSDNGGNKLAVAFRFNNGATSTIAGVGFELYQNAPNPFVNKTFVGFHLPEATSATLSVYDETGRVLYTTTGDFGKGYNAIALDRTSLNANGVLYYKLETATNSATKKMIQTAK
jgi:hypothetical protein